VSTTGVPTWCSHGQGEHGRRRHGTAATAAAVTATGLPPLPQPPSPRGRCHCRSRHCRHRGAATAFVAAGLGHTAGAPEGCCIAAPNEQIWRSGGAARPGGLEGRRLDEDARATWRSGGQTLELFGKGSEALTGMPGPPGGLAGNLWTETPGPPSRSFPLGPSGPHRPTSTAGGGGRPPGRMGVCLIDQTSQVLTGLGECCAHIHQVPPWYGPEPRRYTAAMLLLLMELRGYNSHGAFATAEQ